MVLMLRCSVRYLSHKPNPLTFRKSLDIWFRSLQPKRLQTVQNQLINFMLRDRWDGQTLNNISKHNHNIIEPKIPHSNINLVNNRIRIYKENFINEICFEVVNDPNAITKHIVFIHGYGASLGCFARNWQMFELFKDMKYNYKIHFLDNLSFGLSSNPRISNPTKPISAIIPKCPQLKLNDDTPTDLKNLYNKYYKLIDSFEIDNTKFREYKETFGPIIKDIENYYLDALNKWRISSGIKKIDFLVGHSYGGFWSASYALRHPERLGQLVLLSPVGVERHVHALDSPFGDSEEPSSKLTPTLDPSKYNFLSRMPIIKSKVIRNWYFQPYLPRILKYMGPWGVRKYWDMWYMKLFKINKLIAKRNKSGENSISPYDEVYGTDEEISLIIEYLYNSITSGTVSDIYIKYLLTPSTVSKVPLYDKFMNFIYKEDSEFMDLSPNEWADDFRVHFIYGQYDFMNSEASQKLVVEMNKKLGSKVAKFHSISEGGHNLYIDNPFETNELIHQIVKESELVTESK